MVRLALGSVNGKRRKLFPENADDLVPASAFEKNFGSPPMCGDNDKSSQFFGVTDRVAESTSEDLATHRQIERLVAERDIRAYVHRIAIERRFSRLESWVARLTGVAIWAVATFAANHVSRLFRRDSDSWVWFVTAWGVGLVAFRWIHLGRFRKYQRVK